MTIVGSPCPQKQGQWYKHNTYYQILEVNPVAEKEKNREDQKIFTTVVTKQRGDKSTEDNEEYFYGYFLDEDTRKKLQEYPRKGDDNRLSSYLPSSGVVFSEDFFNSLSQNESKKVEQNELNNFYHPMRTILYSRKISQLIAKTWWSYLKAKESNLFNDFTLGNWDKIIKYKDKDVDGIYILDGLIAREIFLFAGASPPDKIHGDPEILIRKPEVKAVDKARFIILPTSKSWQGISLSLLLAGQAYYQIEEEGKKKYHQISQPILSTGQIVDEYSHEVDWNSFHGDIQEIIVSQEKPWIAYKVVLPYPPIPKDAKEENLKKWADAEDDDGDLPFYRKTEDNQYLIDVNYFRPPYPYIPLSCT